MGRTRLTEEVLAWLITSQGRTTAITIDAQGHVEDADGADAVIPPGERPVSTSLSRSMVDGTAAAS
ncbi:hypothetical protein [Streptomyces sp. OR43]|uniref:hypothetical protein n=1 Tax=Streptomyces sp. or43 TaxID=2478957 RepID=UPI0011CD607C|nr:hypothetical protein [Streptomyces sp. or43]TXS41813.1 hypothetical protein EAO72_16705 [Streptomyces sp. or43]